MIAFIGSAWVIGACSPSRGDERFIQADVYSALYDAYARCDDDLEQSRSEFITEKLQLDSGRITMASLLRVLDYRVTSAARQIVQKTSEREAYVSEILGRDDGSENHGAHNPAGDVVAHEKVRKLDAFLAERRRYLEVHQCVLEALREAHTEPQARPQ